MRFRRAIAVLLLGIFLSNVMEGHQLLKLPALFEHMAEHRSEGPMNWYEFFLEHYVQHGDHPDREHHHHDLPFHSDCHCVSQVLQARLPEGFLVDFSTQPALDRLFMPDTDDMPCTSAGDDVWQPPRP